MEDEKRKQTSDDVRAGDAETMERLQEEIRNLPVSEHLLYMMHSLSALAVGRLGLTADTAGRRDLDEARLAIEAFKALIEVDEKARPADETRIHKETLSQLQLAYAAAVRAAETAVKAAETAVKAAETDSSPASEEPPTPAADEDEPPAPAADANEPPTPAADEDEPAE